MKHFKSLVLGFLIGCAVFSFPLTSLAQQIDVSPESYDYGDVTVNDTANMIFTIENTYTDDVEVFLLILTTSDVDPTEEYDGTDFAITDSPAPLILEGLQSADVEVTFTPTSAGEFSVYLFMFSSDTGASMLWFPLSGRGVSIPPPVVQEMSALIDSFNTAITSGNIGGTGPGSSANGRLGAFGNMLNAANDLIAVDEKDTACIQLLDAFYRCDGDFPPPDFIYGSAREEIASNIMDVIDALGCP